MKNIVAKVVRVLSIPPVVIGAMLAAFRFRDVGMFRSWWETALAFLFLAVIPLLAYPLHAAIPALRRRGREGQRKFAFLLTAVGYVAGTVYAFIAGTSALKFLFSVYLLSVAVLLFFNGVVRLRASGHACSVTGPVLLSAWFLGWVPALVGAAVWALVFWASLVTKRHTAAEFVVGTLVALVSFLLSLPVLFFL